ncbi:hypothetical protein pb186bvf_015673 [Paramecium bursaria]
MKHTCFDQINYSFYEYFICLCILNIQFNVQVTFFKGSILSPNFQLFHFFLLFFYITNILMRKYSEQPLINTDWSMNYPSGKSTFTSEESGDFQLYKIKTSQPQIFSDQLKLSMPLQLQLSPIQLSRRESGVSRGSDHFDFSVKEIKPRRLEYDEETQLRDLITREKIIIEEQEFCNRKMRQIYEDTFSKLSQLETDYLNQRSQILKTLVQQTQPPPCMPTPTRNSQMIKSKILNSRDVNTTKEDQPLKSALKKNPRQLTAEKEMDDSEDDWDFIKLAKINLQKQKTQIPINLDEKQSPSKVRFVNPKEAQKKFHKKQYTNDLKIYLKQNRC